MCENWRMRFLAAIALLTRRMLCKEDSFEDETKNEREKGGMAGKPTFKGRAEAERYADFVFLREGARG